MVFDFQEIHVAQILSLSLSYTLISNHCYLLLIGTVTWDKFSLNTLFAFQGKLL